MKKILIWREVKRLVCRSVLKKVTINGRNYLKGVINMTACVKAVVADASILDTK